MDIPIEKILERLDIMEGRMNKVLNCLSQKVNHHFTLLLTMNGLRDYLYDKTGKRPAKATICGWISKKSVPYIKRDHSVLFERERIDAWLISGRRSSNDEIIVIADQRMVAANRKRRTSIAR
jgi:hypothetical protein